MASGTVKVALLRLAGDLVNDARYALRTLRRSPSFVLVALVSLGLGIGTVTAVFHVIDAVFLRPLQIWRPNELVEVRMAESQGFGVRSGEYGEISRPLWDEIRMRQQVFSGTFAWRPDTFVVGHQGESQLLRGMRVGGDFFEVLRVQPWRGRLLTLLDEKETCPPKSAVVGYLFWQRYLGGQPINEGSHIYINGGATQVVGVTPPDFSGLVVGNRFDIALPLCQQPARRDVFDLIGMGRLRTGITIQAASTQLRAISAGAMMATDLTGYSTETREAYGRAQLTARSAATGVSLLRNQYDSYLWLLLAVTALVLTMACINLANLVLVKGGVRRHELALRLALGASRPRILRQLVTESLLLASAGACIGLGIAQAFGRGLVSLLSTTTAELHLPMITSWRVLLFACTAAAVTSTIVGVLPAFSITSVQPIVAMRSGGRGSVATALPGQRTLVALQVAMSITLAFTALLFIRSFHRLSAVDAGVRLSGIVVAMIDFQAIPAENADKLEERLLDAVKAIPAVLNVAATTIVPLSGDSWGHKVTVGSIEGGSRFTWVTPSYFDTLGIPVLTGRGFDSRDTPDSAPSAIVNQTFCARYLSGIDPIGKLIRTSPEPGYPSTTYEIVGVIPDTKYDSLRRATPPMTFAPIAQLPTRSPWIALIVHSKSAPAFVIEQIKRQLVKVDPMLLTEFMDLRRHVKESLARERLIATLTGFLGVLAILLVAVGLYSVISYVVVRRHSEIAIRVALGATQLEVVGMILRECRMQLTVGVMIGMLLSVASARSARAMLFGLAPHDPFTLLAACLLVSLIALTAIAFPAYRAARIEPMRILRQE